MVCHLGAKPAGAAAPVKGGDVIEVQWTPWPASHKGPVLDYLANCNGPCETVDKTKLKFFKIGEAGWIDKASDLWAANVLANNNNSWFVRIPEDIAPGNYVLRHEIIALHAAGNPNGAQSYPFCFNLAIDSKGTANPAGIPVTEFYKANDPGIKFDLFSHPTAYVIPGVSRIRNFFPCFSIISSPLRRIEAKTFYSRLFTAVRSLSARRSPALLLPRLLVFMRILRPRISEHQSCRHRHRCPSYQLHWHFRQELHPQ
ncbi:glycosyl hydrolase family 61-domain-containing protein [Daldinia caldariorum]|uniref:glycosyl hydrolase family 61-domain-containing protein n=1 Tax=Daldinia caldariorum TaxID=326644 RepID=UPI00200738E3|nr:glycosyl hydrolase family 61-domain-containing protein [Daldinia caldariorum]KAI1471486.1 glycosyl hydrolase family 61-domain-containing protein [Daldinia caldariorum]